MAIRSIRRMSALAALALLSAGVAPARAASGSPTAQWQAALANRQSAPAVWLAMGDSIVEGQGASAMSKRWTNLTLGRLRAAFPTSAVTGGIGYLPGWDYLYGPDSTWKPYTSRSGSVSNVSSPTSLGLLTARLSKSASQTYTVTGTSADVLYDAGGGTFSYAVDGGRATSVNTAGTFTPAKVVHVPFAARGTHTVKITSTSGAVYLEGLLGYDGDENAGIRLVSDAHAGYDSSSFVADRTNLNTLYAMIKPDLVTIDWAANDYLNSTHTPAQVTANLQGEIANLRSALAAKPPSIVLQLNYPMGTSRNGLGYVWSDYVAAVKAVVAADPSVGLLDFSGLSTAPADGMISVNDGIHPSDKGQAALAGMASTYLSTAQ